MSEQQTTFSDYDEATADVDTAGVEQASADVDRLVDRLDQFEEVIEDTLRGLEYVVDNLDAIGDEADESSSQNPPDEQSELAYQ